MAAAAGLMAGALVSPVMVSLAPPVWAQVLGSAVPVLWVGMALTGAAVVSIAAAEIVGGRELSAL